MERTLSLNAVPKKYDEAFKRQAVEMVLRGGKKVREVAEDLGVSQYSIYQWKKKFFPLSARKAASFVSTVMTPAAKLETVGYLSAFVLRHLSLGNADIKGFNPILLF